MPPTTPPAMAPTGTGAGPSEADELEDELLVVEVDLVDVVLVVLELDDVVDVEVVVMLWKATPRLYDVPHL